MQLPTYDGTKSYQNLLVGVYGGIDIGNNRDAILRRKPSNFVNAGDYHYNGYLGGRGGNNYWLSVTRSSIVAANLYFTSNYFNPQEGYQKGSGFSLRCLGR